MASKEISIQASVGKTYRVDLQARDHSLIIDQAKNAGGEDLGPSPLEYFFFSLGGCICTIARIMANQQRIELRNLTTRVVGSLNVDVLMGKSKEDRAGFESIKVYTTIDADMTPEEKKVFLAEVDARCPISDNIHGLTPIEFLLED